jgi:hypothetical protein
MLARCHVVLSAGGYFVAIMLVFLGSLVGLKLPGLFSGGEATAAVVLAAAAAAAFDALNFTGCAAAEQGMQPVV